MNPAEKAEITGRVTTEAPAGRGRVDTTSPSMTPVAIAPLGGWVLKLLSGPAAGNAVTLTGGRDYVFGRGKDADIVLAEDLVSRRHAQLACGAVRPVITDLGSTNGTFVNGERVVRALLQSGDRILVGTTIARILAVDEVAKHTHEASTIQPVRTQQTSTMAGRLEEVPAVDLLQLFSNSKKSGALRLRGESGSEGEIVLVAGRIAAARIELHPHLTHRKALVRLLREGKGVFEFIPALAGDAPPEVPLELQEPTEMLLIDSLRLADEYALIAAELPKPETTLGLVRPLPGRLSSLDASSIDLIQLVFEHERFDEVLERSPLADVEVGRTLLRLVGLGYLQVSS